MDTITDCDELQHHSQSSEGQKRAPEVLQSILVIDMADISKAKRDARQAQSECQTNNGNEPPKCECTIEEFVSWYDLPADLHMESECTAENPDDNGPATEHQKCPTDCADAAGLHIIGSDLIEALIRLPCQRDNESKLQRCQH